MGSKGVTRVTDKTTGHGPYKPRPTKSQDASGGSPNVFANNLAVNRVDDLWEPHGGIPPGPHSAETGVTKTGSSTVFANGKPVARIGDQVDNEGDKIAGGSPDVFAGD